MSVQDDGYQKAYAASVGPSVDIATALDNESAGHVGSPITHSQTCSMSSEERLTPDANKTAMHHRRDDQVEEERHETTRLFERMSHKLSLSTADFRDSMSDASAGIDQNVPAWTFRMLR
jgi:hypothetical protein